MSWTISRDIMSKELQPPSNSDILLELSFFYEKELINGSTLEEVCQKTANYSADLWEVGRTINDRDLGTISAIALIGARKNVERRNWSNPLRPQLGESND